MAAVFIAPCWLRVTLRPDVKTEAATADALVGADDSKVSFRTTGAGELLRTELQLLAGKGRKGKFSLEGQKRVNVGVAGSMKNVAAVIVQLQKAQITMRLIEKKTYTILLRI